MFTVRVCRTADGERLPLTAKTETAPSRFDRYVQRIQNLRDAREAAGHSQLGVRFLYGPRESLNVPNGNVILGINPGGEQDLSDRLWTAKTAYYSETWTSSDYQLFVRVFMQSVFTFGGSSNWQLSWDRSVTSNLFPFRSRGVSDLSSAELSSFIKFGRGLWKDIFQEIRPRLIVTFGGPTRDAMLFIANQLCWSTELLRSYPANQRNTSAELFAFSGPVGEGRMLLAPHYAHGHGARGADVLREMALDIAPFAAL